MLLGEGAFFAGVQELLRVNAAEDYRRLLAKVRIVDLASANAY